MLARRLALVVLALSTPATALAAPPANAPAKTAAPRRRAPKPKEPAAPKPNVTLTIDAPSPHGPWKMRVENTGDVPLRLVADAHLLTLVLSVPGAKKKAKPIVCSLPADMRPFDDVDRAVVLAPKRSYSETFDPRLYCFGATAAGALATGTKVVGHLGWMKSHGSSAPFVVSPFEGVEPAVRAEKEIAAAEVEIGAEGVVPSAAASADTTAPKAGDNPYPVRLTLAAPKHLDVEAPRDVPMSVTVKNEGVRSVTLLLRPETLAFDVIGPHSTSHCAWPMKVGGTVREAFTTLGAKKGESVAVLLDALCPDSTFDQAGLYVVRPRLDTRHADGETVGLSAFAGEIIGTSTTLLRVHRGAKPARSVRPTLDPL